MHRAALPAMGILGVAGVAGVAAADPWTVRMESGAEADSNVTRVEDKPISAAVGRLGGRIDYRDALLGGTYAAEVSGLARMVASAQNKDESVMLDAGELRWLHPIGGSSLAAGVHLTAADSFGVLVPTGARTYRNLGGDALVMLGHGEDHHLMLGVGWRDFVYKQVTGFDWRGPVASARLDSVLWHTPDRTRSLELAAVLGFEARSYNDVARFNCAPDGSGNSCPMDSTLRRRDRYQRGGLELTWTGAVVATGGYQLTVVDSNSYGQSLIRQRITAAATMEVVTALFVSATATLQIDQYPEGVPNLLHQELTSLEDENRSSLQVLITRALSTAWSLEVRGAIWRDFGTAGASFRRELAYAGVLYQH
ncbi:MAG TPA: hypothetical protein VHT91_12430 [Kofleriaceae bacterium]|jgi:hypothetical protein|nr:hypothetical protein [Kofleriaceae bacterium]